jgi:hypothetical protein
VKNLLLLVFALFAAGNETAISSPLLYEFSFRVPPFSETDISYVSDAPTIPGTDVTDLLPVSPNPFPFPILSGFRDVTGAWSFTVRVMPTVGFTYIAQTDTTFLNLPGQYLGLPALLTQFGLSSPGTVDISIEAVPEPRTSLLMLAGLVVFCRSVNKSRTNCTGYRAGRTA